MTVWPQDAPDGITAGTKLLTSQALDFEFGRRFPAGWKPVQHHPHIAAWDMAPSWYAPPLIAWRWIKVDIRMKTAGALYRLAHLIAGTPRG